ncbi:hypothetical protein MHTCC0001_21830 [Flavobacteriaceae bacterium MHTCC 0001]
MEFTKDELKVLVFIIDNELALNRFLYRPNSSEIGNEIGLSSHFTRKALKSLTEKGIIESKVDNGIRSTKIKVKK